MVYFKYESNDKLANLIIITYSDYTKLATTVEENLTYEEAQAKKDVIRNFPEASNFLIDIFYNEKYKDISYYLYFDREMAQWEIEDAEWKESKAKAERLKMYHELKKEFGKKRK